MTRVQVSDDFGGGRLQTQARPIAATEQVAAPVEDTRWKALADVFAQGAGLADTMRQQQEDEEKARAKSWAQSMTVGELGKKIQNGEMMPSQSPVFVGTVQHIWGVNSYEAGLRDMTSKLTRGDLKFNSQEEADQYLTEWRNTTLAGQSKYAIAGFDKGYAGVRDKVMDHVAKSNDKEWVDSAQAQAADFLANSLNSVTGPDFKGTPQEAAASLMQQYQLMRHTKTLPDGAAKGAIGEMLSRMAAGGKPEVLSAFLDTEMEGIGKVRNFIGESKAQTLSNHATTVFDGQQRQRIDDETLPWYQAADKGELNVEKFREWGTSEANKKYVSSATIHSIERANLAALAAQQRALEKSSLEGAIAASDVAADRQIEAALVNGRLSTVMGTNRPSTLRKSGDMEQITDGDLKERAERIAVRRSAGMPFEQQVGFFAQNGLENPNWKATLNEAFFNLDTIGVDSNGKPRGSLNESGKRGLELFKQLNLYGDYAKSLMSEKQFNRFDNIAFLTHMGRSVDDAAGLASSADLKVVEGSDVDKLIKDVKSQVAKIQADPFYKMDWAQRMWGDNTVANTAQMTGTLRRYSELLAHSGQYPDAGHAIEAAFKYIAHPAVSTKVNGTVYLRSEMPMGPKSQTQEEWFERFISEVPKARAKETFGKDHDVRLEWNPASKAYQAYVGGVPLTQADGSLAVYSRESIQDWYATKEQLDVTAAAARGAGRVKSIKDTREAGGKISKWAKDEFNKGTKPKAAPAPEEPTFRQHPVIDFSGLKNADPNAKPGQRQP